MEERRQNITKEICDLKHKPIDDFVCDTKLAIKELHKKLNWGVMLLIGTLAGIVATYFKY